MTEQTEAELVMQAFTEIGAIDQLVSGEFQRVIAPELGVSEFRVLNHFTRNGDGATPTYLAKTFQVTKPSMTAIIGKLEAKGFVRVEPSKQDKRQKFVYLTDTGRAARKKAIVASAPAVEHFSRKFRYQGLIEILPVLQELREYLDDARIKRERKCQKEAASK